MAATRIMVWNKDQDDGSRADVWYVIGQRGYGYDAFGPCGGWLETVTGYDNYESAALDALRAIERARHAA